MKQPRRLIITSLFLAGVLLLAQVFSPFMLNDILMSTALTVWMLMRIFILSIDQQVYWLGLAVAALFALSRYSIQHLLLEDSEPLPKNDLIHTDIDLWKSYFTSYALDKNERFIVKRELTRLLVSLYASKHGVTANFMVADDLRSGEIPLPEEIHAFLFEEVRKQTRRSFKQILLDLWLAPRGWMDERSGRRRAEYYRNVGEVLNFIETSLEVKR